MIQRLPWMVDGRLIGGPILKIAKPDKAHIAEFWWVTNFLRLSDNRPAHRQKDQNPDKQAYKNVRLFSTAHCSLQPFKIF
jgi:hypothetical protein